VKRKLVKPMLPLKNKRLVKVQKYREMNSDEESVSSKETIKGTKSTTSKRSSALSSLIRNKKFDNHNLRSSRSLSLLRKGFSKFNDSQSAFINDSVKTSKNAETSVALKSNKESITAKDGPREKITTALKRKRDSIATDKEKEKLSTSKSKFETAKGKGKQANSPVDSEEESLGAILNKMKRKKESEREDSISEALAKKSAESKAIKSMTVVATAIQGTSTTTISTSTATTTMAIATTTTSTITTTSLTSTINKTTMTTTTTTTSLSSTAKATTVEMLKSQAASEALTTKISDDEESFRGFTKKAISKVVSTCQSHVKANKLMDEIDSKANVFKAHGVASNMSSTMKDSKKIDIKVSTSSFPYIKLMPDKLINSGMIHNVANASVKQEPDFIDLKVSTNQIYPFSLIIIIP
jgi:hypothetical protein